MKIVSQLALILLSSAASASAQEPARHLRRVTQPLIPAELDLATGRYTVGPRVSKRSASFNTSRTLSNLDFAGFAGIDSVQCEWFDSALKGQGKTGGRSQIMTSFVFAYCSTARAVNSGGVGGSATISFIEGYSTPAVGTPRPSFGTRTAVFNLSGLPANTAGCSFFSCFRCHLITVRTAAPSAAPGVGFEGGQALADGALGWSWDFRDLDQVVGPRILAATFPFLACVTSCSGVGPDGQTMVDGVDRYCPAPRSGPGAPVELRSTFTFGTAVTAASLNMEIREANAIASGDALHNPTTVAGTNPLILVNLVPPVLGQTLVNQLDCSAASVSRPAIFRYEFRPGSIAPYGTPAVLGNVLVSLAAGTGRNLVLPSHNQGVVAPPLPLPVDLQFLNASYEVQGLCGDSPKGFLSNARAQTVGSF